MGDTAAVSCTAQSSKERTGRKITTYFPLKMVLYFSQTIFVCLAKTTDF
jgi:hypothetical protein